jgi:hypothetical protein
MLQWNSKIVMLLVVALLVAIAAIAGSFNFELFNFTW